MMSLAARAEIHANPCHPSLTNCSTTDNSQRFLFKFIPKGANQNISSKAFVVLPLGRIKRGCQLSSCCFCSRSTDHGALLLVERQAPEEN